MVYVFFGCLSCHLLLLLRLIRAVAATAAIAAAITDTHDATAATTTDAATTTTAAGAATMTITTIAQSPLLVLILHGTCMEHGRWMTSNAERHSELKLHGRHCAASCKYAANIPSEHTGLCCNYVHAPPYHPELGAYIASTQTQGRIECPP